METRNRSLSNIGHHGWALLTVLAVVASLWLLPPAEGQNIVTEPFGFGPVFITDGETGRVVAYNTSTQAIMIDILLMNSLDGGQLVGSLKGVLVGPGGMAAAQYVEPVGGAFRTEIFGMVRVLKGNPSGLLSSFQLVESDGRTGFFDIWYSNPGFAPVGLLNETGRLAAFNSSAQTVVLDLDIINIATNTLLATFKGGMLPPNSSISVEAIVGGTRTEVVGMVHVVSGSLIGVISSFQVIGADNRTRFLGDDRGHH